MGIRDTFVADMNFIIDDELMSFTIERDSFVDKAKGKKAKKVFGPFEGTLAEFKHTRVYSRFQEVGTTSKHGFTALLRDITTGPAPIDEIKLEDIVLTGNQRFVVTSAPEVYGGIVEINLDLLQSPNV